MLQLSEAECCTIIDNTSPSIEEARAEMREISDQMGELCQSMPPRDWFDGLDPESWIATILKSLGLTQWRKWLVQIGIVRVTGFPFIIIGKDLLPRLKGQVHPSSLRCNRYLLSRSIHTH